MASMRTPSQIIQYENSRPLNQKMLSLSPSCTSLVPYNGGFISLQQLTADTNPIHRYYFLPSSYKKRANKKPKLKKSYFTLFILNNQTQNNK